MGEYGILRKTYLNKFEIESAFDIVKNNIINLGIDVSEKDREIWISSLNNNLSNKDFYFYLLYNDGKIAGFMEMIKSNGKLTLSEIQLNDSLKRTRILPFLINYILNEKAFSEFDELYFSIKKVNNASNATFSHLGGEIVEDRGKNWLYRISREKVSKYMKKMSK